MLHQYKSLIDSILPQQQLVDTVCQMHLISQYLLQGCLRVGIIILRILNLRQVPACMKEMAHISWV